MNSEEFAEALGAEPLPFVRFRHDGLGMIAGCTECKWTAAGVVPYVLALGKRHAASHASPEEETE